MPRTKASSAAGLAKAKEAMLTNPGSKAWEFNPEIDTYKSYIAFVKYRDLGPERTLEKLVEDAKNPSSYYRVVAEWSRLHDWQGRTLAFDLWKDQLKTEALVKKEVNDHVRLVSKYKQSLSDISWLNVELAMKCSQVAMAALEENYDTPEKRRNLRAADIRAIAQAGSACIEQATHGLNEVLQIAQLLEAIDKDVVDIESEEIA